MKLSVMSVIRHKVTRLWAVECLLLAADLFAPRG